MVFLVLIAISVPVSMNLTVAGDEPAALTLEKECVLFGRILGHQVLLYPEQQVTEPVFDLPEMKQISDFEVLNKTTGEWYPLTLSEEGYFCANVGMGKHELRGRDCDGRPYVIHNFNIPKGMAANLGDFWVETCDPTVVSREGWFTYFNEEGWQEYREGSDAIALRIEHIVSDEAYEECENWFAECHEDAYDQFSSVIARR
jgi:hypothetical protein